MGESKKHCRPFAAIDAFMRGQVNQMTIAASFQRNKIYSVSATDKHKQRIRNGLIERLEEIADDYRSTPKKPPGHYTRIEKLASDMSNEFNDQLFEGRFRIGTAQKALNLYLKYLWCLDWLKVAPPHCPFDAIVIGHLDGCQDIKWTEMDSMEEYKQLVRAAIKKSNGASLALWELKIYNDELMIR